MLPFPVLRAGCITVVLGVFSLAVWWFMPDLYHPLVGSEAWTIAGLASAWAALNLLGWVLDKRELLNRQFEEFESEEEEEPRQIPNLDFDVNPVTIDNKTERPFQYLVELRDFEAVGITEARLQDVSRRVLDKKEMFSNSKFTPRRRGFSKNEFAQFVGILERKKCVRQNNPKEPRAGVCWTREGIAFLKRLKDHSPTGD
jgi:hypothetical protein